MISADELLFTVDENNNPIKSESRSFVHKQGLWHRTTAIWVMNKNKQILCQQRSLTKDVNPGMWEACFGGHIGKDENAESNARTEIKEELGIELDGNSLVHFKVVKNDKPTHKTFVYIYAALVDNVEFKIQDEEVAHVEWRNLSEIKTLLTDSASTDWVKKSSDSPVIDWLSELKV